jgi:hypothetical protein
MWADHLRDLNAMILDYLLLEGFPDAAVEFARETGLPADVDHATIQERMEIQEAVEEGRVEEAVRRVNELDPEVSLPGLCPFVSLLLPTPPPQRLYNHAPRLARLAAWPCGNNLIYRPDMRGNPSSVRLDRVGDPS